MKGLRFSVAVVVLSLLFCSCQSGRRYGYWDSGGFRELRPLYVEVE